MCRKEKESSRYDIRGFNEGNILREQVELNST
jgi:hypothetical protein